MSVSNQFRSLRAAPIFEAGGVNDATVRTWIAQYSLMLGDRAERETGRPRYDLSDCARLFILSQLTKSLGVRGESAVWVVNAASPYLDIIATAELAGLDDLSKAPDCPRYILSIQGASLSRQTAPTIRLWSDPEEIAERNADRGYWLEVRMDLREQVRGARNLLASTLNISLANMRHDFADCPEAHSESAQ